MNRLIGYGRVLQSSSATEEQKKALLAAGCSKVFWETYEGSIKGWPVLKDALAYSQAGDTFVVERLDRMGRTISQVVSTLFKLDKRGVGFRSLKDEFDIVSTPASVAIKTLYELEKIMHRSRLAEGAMRVRAKRAAEGGPRRGRPKKLSDEQIALARALLEDNVPGQQIARMLNVNPRTVTNYAADLSSVEGL